jgi:hypothetical protein
MNDNASGTIMDFNWVQTNTFVASMDYYSTITNGWQEMAPDDESDVFINIVTIIE